MPDRCMLMILDGWGIASKQDGNAIAQADTPVLDGLMADYPTTQLKCSGEAVGLPAGVMGNSEVGHLNIGAGRVVYQDLLRIDQAIEDQSFFSNDALKSVMSRTRQRDSALHLIGLVSDGGVHSQLTHLFALLKMARDQGVPRACVHAILDGRDTSPTGGAGYLASLTEKIQQLGFGTLVSICGRYYAMDRDKRWQRVEQAYRLFVLGEGTVESDPVTAVKNAYQRGETDEFIKPIILDAALSEAAPCRQSVQDDDGIIFFNFRADRARQITRAFTEPAFAEFDRPVLPRLCGYVTMTQYDQDFSLPVAYPPVHLQDILGEVVSHHGLRQLRIAETEKYAHVTYFFNGGEETPFPNEDRCLIPSPRDVPTYDHKPEMSAVEVTDEVLERIGSGRYDLIVLNFANLDMVGHTGVIPAAIKACETVDACIGKIVTQLKSPLIVTADHGNAEKMLAENGSIYTAHTTNRVPLVLVDDSRKNVRLGPGALCDIAPTILDIMGIEQPELMTGRSLIKHD